MFEQLESFNGPNDIRITSFRSSSTGLMLVHTYIAGPLVQGFFTLATATDSNDGCPHTLEHLVFMGSDLFPYKGVLDALANRQHSQGTNAWTAVDHTAYTLETAGADGFATLLPVYIDHILFPTLTDSAYVTEVHHITGTGIDGGVVYSEMQARENTADSIAERRLMTALYADTPYASETGGLLHDIRQLNVERIRAYHSAYYRPDNFCVVVCGDMSVARLLETMSSVEERIMTKGASATPIPRPFSFPVKPLAQSSTTHFAYASDDVDVGCVSVGWLGPPWHDFLNRSALHVVWTYLTASSTSPLQRRFVEDMAICGGVDFNEHENSTTAFAVEFDAVNVEALNDVHSLLISALSELVSRGDIDMKKLRAVIVKEKRTLLSEFEESPHHTFATEAVAHFLYAARAPRTAEAPDRGELYEQMNTAARLDTLTSKPLEYWIDIIKTWIIQRPNATIIGKPSQAEAERLRTVESERINTQIAALGAPALSHRAKTLDDATRANAVEPPPSLLESFAPPDATQIRTIPTYTVRTGGIAPPPTPHPHQTQLDALFAAQPSLYTFPVFTQINHVPSNFATFALFLDTQHLSADLLRYLPLLREAMFELPIRMADGTLRTSDAVVDLLEEELVSYENAQGIRSGRFGCGSFSQFVHVSIKIDGDQYRRGIEWLNDICYRIEFTAERVKIAAKKLLAAIPELKNDGSAICNAAMQQCSFQPSGVHYATNFIRQQIFLKSILRQMNRSERSVQLVIDALNQVRSSLTAVDNMRLHVAADCVRVGAQLIPSLVQCFVPPKAALSVKGRRRSGDGIVYVKSSLIPFSTSQSQTTPLTNYVLAVPACESSYLNCTAPLSNDFHFEHADYIPLRLAMEYLCALEGPLWKRIRGLGLSYSYGMRVDVEQGLTYLTLYKATNVVDAYTEARSIVDEFISGKTQWSDSDVRAAKSSLVYEVVSATDTIVSAANQSFINYLRREAPGNIQRDLQTIRDCTTDQLNRALHLYIRPLFDQDKSRLTLTTNPLNAENIFTAVAADRQAVLIDDVTAFFVPIVAGKNKAHNTCDFCSSIKHHAIAHKHTYENDDDDNDDSSDDEEDDDPLILPGQRVVLDHDARIADDETAVDDEAEDDEDEDDSDESDDDEEDDDEDDDDDDD